MLTSPLRVSQRVRPASIILTNSSCPSTLDTRLGTRKHTLKPGFLAKSQRLRPFKLLRASDGIPLAKEESAN